MNALVIWFKSKPSPVGRRQHLPRREAVQQARMTQWLTGTLAVLALTLWISMAEVDRLIASAATATGRSASASSLQAIDPRLGQENWSLWSNLNVGSRDDVEGPVQAMLIIDRQMAILLGTYFMLDAIFACLYTALLLRLLWQWRWIRGLVFLILVSELTESALQLVTLGQLQPGTGSSPQGIAGWLAAAPIVTTIKWLGLAALIVSFFAVPWL